MHQEISIIENFVWTLYLKKKQLSETLIIEEVHLLEGAEREAFCLKDARAKSVIVQCITDKHLDLVKDAKTARKMMQTLVDIFERKSVVSKLMLKRKLLTLKLIKKDELEDHFLNFDTTIRELENAGSKMEESDKVCYLLLSLSDEYESIITVIETLNNDVTMEFVKSRLLDEESKLKSKINYNGCLGGITFKALHLQLVCYKCGKEGHKANDCYKLKRDNKSFKRGKGYRSCGIGWGVAESTSKANQEEEKEIAFATFDNGMVNDINAFILASGAMQHLVLSNLEKYMEDVQMLQKEARWLMGELWRPERKDW